MGLKTTSLPHGNLQSVEWSKHLNWNNIALLVLQELMVILQSNLYISIASGLGPTMLLERLCI